MLRPDLLSRWLPWATHCPKRAYRGFSPRRSGCPFSLRILHGQHVHYLPVKSRASGYPVSHSGVVSHGMQRHRRPGKEAWSTCIAPSANAGTPWTTHHSSPTPRSIPGSACAAKPVLREKREPCPKPPARFWGSRAVLAPSCLPVPSGVPALHNSHLQPPDPCPLQASGTGQSKQVLQSLNSSKTANFHPIPSLKQ